MELREIKTKRGYDGIMSSILYDREEKQWVGKCVLRGCTYSTHKMGDIIPLSDIIPNEK